MIKKYLKFVAYIGLMLSSQSYGFSLNPTDGTKIGSTLVVSSVVTAIGFNKLINYAQSQGKISPAWTRFIKGYGAVRTLAVIGFGLSMFSKPTISPSVSLSHNIIAANLMCLPGMLEMALGGVAYSKMFPLKRS